MLSNRSKHIRVRPLARRSRAKRAVLGATISEVWEKMGKLSAFRLLLLAAVLVVTFCATTASAATVQVRFWSQGGLVLVDRGVPTGMSSEEAAVQALVAGPTMQELSIGMTSRIPFGVSVDKFSLSGASAEIELSAGVLDGLGEAALEGMFEQFRATLGDYPSISTIKLTCGGKLLSSYLAHSPEVGLPAGPNLVSINGVGLAGHKICIGPSHGKYWVGWWGWQRSDPCAFGTAVLEDTNSIRLVQFLKQYLTQDGATFYSPRQLDESDCCNSDTGLPWWQMCAQTWLHHVGAPTSVWASSSGNTGADTAVDRSGDDIRCRPLWADYNNTDIYIACHTNAGGAGTATGTETYYDSQMEHPSWITASNSLATNVENNVLSAIQTTYDGSWTSHGVGVKDSAGAFGEIRIPNRPACLIELAFHDDCARDASYLTDNFFRSVAEWGLYKGVCAYFGNTPTWDKYSCEYVSNDIPTSMVVGERYTVHVTMRNRGVLWNDARAFHLGAAAGTDPFSVATRQTITGEVGPGSTYAFTFTLRAPLTLGTYTTQWQMVRDGYSWFGPVVSQSIVVSGTPDTQAPTAPTDLSATAINEMRVDLSWTASTDDRGVIGYNIYRNNVKIGTSATTSYSDVTCQPSTTYTYEVTAYDDFTNESGRSLPALATTPLPSPPTTPQNLHGTASTTSTISMAWDASTDNLGVIGYRVFRNGVQVGTTAGTSYTDSGLNYSTPYNYQVDAYDAVPSYSAKSTTVPLSTQTPGYYTWSQTTSNGDCYIRSGSPTTTGNSAGIQSGWSSTPAIAVRRGLVQWDMTGAPAQSTIVNAAGSVRVKLYCYLRSVNTATDIYLNSVTADWTEGGATWNSNAANYGLLFATTSVTAVGDYTWSWNGNTLGLPLQNRGVIVRNANESSANPKIFTDKEQTGGANPKPRLEVDYYDVLAPVSCSININSGAVYTTSPAVTLTLSATDFPSGMGIGAQMQFSDDGTNFSTPEAYVATRSYNLPAGDGLKTVYAKFKDVAGNWSAPVSDTITLDTTAPAGTITINGGATHATSSTVTLTVSSIDAVQMQFRNANGTWSTWETYATTKTWPLSAGDGEKTVYVQFKDAAGNVSTDIILDEITLDTSPPTISIGAPSTAWTKGGPVTYTITYGGADSITLANGDVTLNKTGTADAGSVVVSGTDPTTRTVTISGVTGKGSLGISIAASTASDLAGNTAPVAGPSATFVVGSYGLTNKAVVDSIMGTASGLYKFTLWGKVTAPITSDSFYVDDGSGTPVKVNFAGHGFTDADYVSATGTLDVSGASPVLNALVVKKQN
jgi:chitodextrinase